LITCKKEDLKAPVPAYITIEDIVVETKDTDDVSSSDNIKDAWVYLDNQLIGAFELPTTIPIQKTGNVKLRVRGGIHNNGLSSDRKVYPFYEFYNLDTTIAPEEVITLTPKVNYKERTVFDSEWPGEDFEGGISFKSNSQSDADLFLERDTKLVFEGQASGAVLLNESMDFFEAYTDPSFSNIPRNGTEVYLEMNYRSTHDIAVSIYVNDLSQQFSVVNFKASDSWNKVYVEFTSVFSTLFNARNYNIAIGFTKPTGEKAALYLDNMKLLHY
jgi:hypothetical protein